MVKMRREGDDVEYAIIKYNVKTGEKQTICSVTGRDAADSRAIHYESRISEPAREDGWTFYTERAGSTHAVSCPKFE